MALRIVVSPAERFDPSIAGWWLIGGWPPSPARCPWERLLAGARRIRSSTLVSSGALLRAARCVPTSGHAPHAARQTMIPRPDQRRAFPARIATAALAAVWLLVAAFGAGGSPAMQLVSSAFTDAQPIPRQHTCEGADVSPPLAWRGVPAGTRSLVLIVDDPDAPDPAAPRMTWVHWLLYNLPAESGGLPEGVRAGALPAGTLQGVNDWKRTGYGGPCPPIGRHRYFFKLYALDALLPDLGHPAKAKLESAMQGHVVGQAVLMGTYQKGR